MLQPAVGEGVIIPRIITKVKIRGSTGSLVHPLEIIMKPQKVKVIGNHVIEEFCWHGEFPVYVDNKLVNISFEHACRLAEDEPKDSADLCFEADREMIGEDAFYFEGESHMFSVAEKKKISEEIEKLLLSLNHPEMPKEKPSFRLHVDGKEAWSWADIKPNWKYSDTNPRVNPWNEVAREKMSENR